MSTAIGSEDLITFSIVGQPEAVFAELMRCIHGFEGNDVDYEIISQPLGSDE
jgi:hypothetical protein